MTKSNSIQSTLRIGLIAGVVALSMCMIGLVESFAERDIVTDRFTMAQLLLFGAGPIAGYYAARGQLNIAMKFVHGLIAGLLSAIPIFLLILLTLVWETIRDSFINVSPDLVSLITLGNESAVSGGLTVMVILVALGAVGALFSLIPSGVQRAILMGILWTVVVGLMSEIFVSILRSRLERSTMDSIFGKTGLQLVPFVALGVFVAIYSYWWNRAGSGQYARFRSRLSPQQSFWSRIIVSAIMIAFILILPSILGVYLTEITNNVGLYILMGLGLNIAVGLAGLLDLGYVTNFAVGSYVMALLTSSSEFAITAEPLSFWLALPICILAAMTTGFVFALPVLRMRGDYLAIATLGFGEIIRVLVKSDAMKETLGGAQGILQIPKASISGFVATLSEVVLAPINGFLSTWDLGILISEEGQIIFGKPPQLFYLIVLACLFMLFISRRLNNSRTGRRWMAMREDEDVAAAMGINTTNAKVVAFTLSAASGGLAGALFAAKLGSIYPTSFQVLISINVLSLIIVGGIGSIPGVIVGAFALIGVPELLREFAEFRLLFYGMALIVMMLVRPEGLWPSEVRKRELSREEDDVGAVPAVSAD